MNCDDFLSVQGICSCLDKNLKERICVETIEKTTSTNTVVKARAVQGAAEGLFIVAAQQSQGRGRLGRSFFSPGNTGLYMSLLLRPKIHPEQATLITTAAAVSICQALEKAGARQTGIKWVNDVFIQGKKVCGILTESGFNSEKGTLDYAVLGVGVNVYAPEGGFPAEIDDIAGFVFLERKENLRNKIAAEFLNSFMSYYDNLSSGNHCSAYAEKCFVVGMDVDVIRGDFIRRAKVLGVNADCSLLVEFFNGERDCLNSGEISIRV